MKTLILYGSGGGNTKVVCDKVASVLGEGAEVLGVKNLKKEVFERAFDLWVLASPTYGHGLLEDYMAGFVYECRSEHFYDKKFAVIGLGDDKYDSDYHIEAASILEKFVRERGGELVCESLRINKSPLPHLEVEVKRWAKNLLNKA